MTSEIINDKEYRLVTLRGRTWKNLNNNLHASQSITKPVKSHKSIQESLETREMS